MSSGGTTEFSDTSKSISSKSYESEVNEKNKRKSVDRGVNAIDLECNIQSERIQKILGNLISRTKIALCIPSLVKNSNILQNTLTPEHLEEVLYIMAQSESIYNIASSGVNMCVDSEGLKNKTYRLLFIIRSYPILQDAMDEILTKMIAEHSVKQNPALEYFLTLNQLKDLMISQLTLTAEKELKMKINVNKSEASRKSLIETNTKYLTLLNTEQQDFEQLICKKKQIIAKIEQELNWLNMEAGVNLKRQILDSDRQMVMISRKHDVNILILHEEDIEIQKTYNQTLRDHMMDEKQLRLRRFKIQTQLKTWILKYDNDMKEKQHDYDHYVTEYESESAKVEKAEEDKAAQDSEYIPLMEERDKEYHEELLEKMKKLSLEHAARVIQVFWRTTQENRAAKKKLKKVVEKLKVQIEIENRKMELLAMKRAKAEKRAEKKQKNK